MDGWKWYRGFSSQKYLSPDGVKIDGVAYQTVED